MPYTPVELRHVRLGRALLGYKRDAVQDLLNELAVARRLAGRETTFKRHDDGRDVHTLVNAFGEFSRTRDQIYLPRGQASTEEILLRQRQLATGYQYFVNFGVSYSFGSIFNNIVNPRFGGVNFDF